MNNKELFEALALLEKEKGIPMDYMIEQIEKAIKTACKNSKSKAYGEDGNDNLIFNVDPEKKTFDVKRVLTVVEEVENPEFEIALESLKNKKKKYAVGDEYLEKLEPKSLFRIGINAARGIIRQGIRTGEKDQMLQEFKSRLGELVTATVERVDPQSGVAIIKIGKAVATLPKSEQVGERVLREGDKIKVLVAGIRDLDNPENEQRRGGPKAMISRTSPELVKRLFEQEVPEIYDGTVEIKAIAREAGKRTKMAVFSNDENIDAIGSCIGTRGDRVNEIVDELGNEKIDIIEYSEDPVEYIAAALSPAKVIKVDILDESGKKCKVTVPDGQLSLAIGNGGQNSQLSLAIGKDGQNVRLAARLTGWKIDIRPESGFYGEEEEESAEETE